MSVEPGKHTFDIWRGATFYTRQILLEGAIGSNPQDLTGYTAEFLVTTPTGTVLYTNVPTIDGINGIIDIEIPSSETATWTWKGAHYKLSITSPASRKDYLLVGAIRVRES